MTTLAFDIVGNKAIPKGLSSPPVSANPYDLGDPEFLRRLLDTGQYDFLKNFGSQNLPGQGFRFSDLYKPPMGTSETMFQDLIKNIGAPSSVDEVQRGIESQTLQELLSGIDRDTRLATGSATADFADRGLMFPGGTSDIAQNALAQIQSDALRTKTGARLGFAGQELGRLKAREEAARGAYGTRYGVGAAADTQGRNIYSQGALSDAEMLNQLLTTQYRGGLTGAGKFADISSERERQYYNNLLESLLKMKGFDVSNTQFFRGLEQTAAQNALGRTAAYDTEVLKKSQQGGGFWDDLWQGALTGAVGGVTSGLTGGITSMGGNFLSNILKGKPKQPPGSNASDYMSLP